MKITMVASGSYEEDYEGQILHLLVSLSEGETVQVNDVISIEMMDDTFIERPVVLIMVLCQDLVQNKMRSSTG